MVSLPCPATGLHVAADPYMPALDSPATGLPYSNSLADDGRPGPWALRGAQGASSQAVWEFKRLSGAVDRWDCAVGAGGGAAGYLDAERVDGAWCKLQDLAPCGSHRWVECHLHCIASTACSAQAVATCTAGYRLHAAVQLPIEDCDAACCYNSSNQDGKSHDYFHCLTACRGLCMR